MNTLYEDISVGLLKGSSLMGTFALPPPDFPSNIVEVNMITSSTMESSNLWIVHLESELASYGNEIPFSPLNWLVKKFSHFLTLHLLILIERMRSMMIILLYLVRTGFTL